MKDKKSAFVKKLVSKQTKKFKISDLEKATQIIAERNSTSYSFEVGKAAIKIAIKGYGTQTFHKPHGTFKVENPAVLQDFRNVYKNALINV